MILKIFFSTILLLVIGCTGKLNNTSSNSLSKEYKSPETLYIDAMNKFDLQEYESAQGIFTGIEKIYPLSNEAIQSQIMSGFIDYIKLDYDTAIMKFTKLIRKYPSLKNIDYVFYMRALCYYEQISDEGLDGKYNNLALLNLEQVINRFPNSKYGKDSYQKIVLVKSNIAAKHMTIARFYQKNKKYTAALNRYKVVIDEFYETKFIPEALYRTSEIYYTMGMIEDSKKIAAILGYNYPNSEWYKFNFNILSEKKESWIFSNFIKNIFNK